MTTPAPTAQAALVEALKLAVRQNEHDMLMTGEELRQCRAAIAQAEAAQPQWKLLEDGKTAIPADWTWCRIEHEPGYPEDVAFGPPRLMEKLKGQLQRYYAMLAEAAQPVEPLHKDVAEIDWHGHGLSWALADSLSSVRGDDWTADDIASAYEAGAKAALRLASIASLTPAAPQPAEAAPLSDLASENAELRHLLAVRVAGALLYADDGELQDNSEFPAIDFKRDTPGEISRKLTDRGLKKLTKPDRVHALVNAGAYPGMSEAFDAHIGAACWTDPAWRQDAATWAAAWKAALSAAEAAPKQEGVALSVAVNRALFRPECQRLSEWALIGPVQRAALESFADALLAAQPQQPAPVPVARVPLTEEQVWADDAIMECNAHIGAQMYLLVALVRAVERAHGIAAPQTPAPGAEGGDGA